MIVTPVQVAVRQAHGPERSRRRVQLESTWIPACAGMTNWYHAKLNEGSGSLPHKAPITAKRVIATESPPQADLRPLGSVLNEQRQPMIFSKPYSPAVNTGIGYQIVNCSFITTPYGRVHTISVVIVRVAAWL